MKRFIQIVTIGLLASILFSCTNARWIVKDKKATDRSEYEILEQHQMLEHSGEVTPENPVLQLDLLSRTEYQYTQRVLAQRTIQDYRLRPGFLALGLGGAGLAFYAANSTALNSNRSPTQRWTLNAVGTVLVASGFLNMKPVGEPRPTGEERYLRSSGQTVQVDTVQVNQEVNETAAVTIQYGDINIYNGENLPIDNGRLQVPLAEKLNGLQLTGPSPGSVNITVNFKDSLYTYEYAVSDILQPYARVTSQLASLRNEPTETPDNIVANLVEGSQVQIQSYEDEKWFQVLYGISEHYLLKKDARIVWQPSDFAEEDRIVTVPHVPFGQIDVESNIPILRGSQKDAHALIITNENYSGELESRKYAHRDGRLIKTYLRNALGYAVQNIFEITDLQSRSTLDSTLSQLSASATDSTELTVYLSGYGQVITEGNSTQLVLLGTNGQGAASPETFALDNLLKQISTITSGKTLVLSDIDFSHSVSTNNNYTGNQAQDIIEAEVEVLTASNPQAAVLLGTQLNQPSSLYLSSGGEDKKHHIFPYFFAKALQQRITNLSSIYQYLERNVSYTARKLYDRPQDPLLLGNTQLDLLDE